MLTWAAQRIFIIDYNLVERQATERYFEGTNVIGLGVIGKIVTDALVQFQN